MVSDPGSDAELRSKELPNPADFVPGSQWIAKATDRNRLNGVPGQARTWVTFALGLDISIYVDKGAGLRFKLSREALAANFTKEFGMTPNQGYVGRQHATTLYK